MKTKLTVLALVAVAGIALAAPQTFDFKDPKGINNAGFKLDAPLESINGSASGVYGTVTFDPGNPDATKGKITVATASLIVPQCAGSGGRSREISSEGRKGRSAPAQKSRNSRLCPGITVTG